MSVGPTPAAPPSSGITFGHLLIVLTLGVLGLLGWHAIERFAPQPGPAPGPVSTIVEDAMRAHVLAEAAALDSVADAYDAGKIKPDGAIAKDVKGALGLAIAAARSTTAAPLYDAILAGSPSANLRRAAAAERSLFKSPPK